VLYPASSIPSIEREPMPRQLLENSTALAREFDSGHIVVAVTLVRHLNTSFRWWQSPVSTVIERSVDYVVQHEAQGKTGCENIALGSGGHILIEGGQGY